MTPEDRALLASLPSFLPFRLWPENDLCLCGDPILSDQASVIVCWEDKPMAVHEGCEPCECCNAPGEGGVWP